jgi:hypothetical protein
MSTPARIGIGLFGSMVGRWNLLPLWKLANRELACVGAAAVRAYGSAAGPLSSRLSLSLSSSTIGFARLIWDLQYENLVEAKHSEVLRVCRTLR